MDYIIGTYLLLIAILSPIYIFIKIRNIVRARDIKKISSKNPSRDSQLKGAKEIIASVNYIKESGDKFLRDVNTLEKDALREFSKKNTKLDKVQKRVNQHFKDLELWPQKFYMSLFTIYTQLNALRKPRESRSLKSSINMAKDMVSNVVDFKDILEDFDKRSAN